MEDGSMPFAAPWISSRPATAAFLRDTALERRMRPNPAHAPTGTWTTLGRYVRPNVVHVPGAARATRSRCRRSRGPAPLAARRRRPPRGALRLADPPARWLRAHLARRPAPEQPRSPNRRQNT